MCPVSSSLLKVGHSVKFDISSRPQKYVFSEVHGTSWQPSLYIHTVRVNTESSVLPAGVEHPSESVFVVWLIWILLPKQERCFLLYMLYNCVLNDTGGVKLNCRTESLSHILAYIYLTTSDSLNWNNLSFSLSFRATWTCLQTNWSCWVSMTMKRSGN